MSSPRSDHRLGVFALAASLLLGVASCEPSPPTRGLGVALSFSLVDAARLALEDELSNGPIPGLDTVLLPEGSPRSGPALQAAQELAERPGMVAVVGHSNSAASLVASQVYNQREIVQIAPTSTAAAYSLAGPFSFRLVPPDGRQGAFLAGAVEDTFPAGTRVAVFYVNDDYGRGLRQAFVTALDTARYPVVLQLPHAELATGEVDTEPGLAALAHANPDVIVWLARPQILQAFLPEIRRRWPDLPIYGGDALTAVPALGFPPELWAGITYTDFLDPDASEAARKFAARFLERFGMPPSGGQMLTYDAVRLVLQALRTGVSTGEELRTYLVELGDGRRSFMSLVGPLAFDENGDVERAYVLRRFPGGAP